MGRVFSTIAEILNDFHSNLGREDRDPDWADGPDIEGPRGCDGRLHRPHHQAERGSSEKPQAGTKTSSETGCRDQYYKTIIAIIELP